MKPPVVAISMGTSGHVQVLMTVVSGLCKLGETVYVLTESAFRRQVESHGARFIDLYERFPINTVDSTSTPVPSRYVTFAGTYGDSLAAFIAGFKPSIVLYDMFAVIGPVVAGILDIPYVGVCPNHAPIPHRVIQKLHGDPRVSTSEACLRAVETLRNHYGMHDASPFSYADGISPHLNIYGEPEEYLDAEERAALEPVAFYGVLTPPETFRATSGAAAKKTRCERVFISFGTVIWWYFEDAAIATLEVIAGSLRDSDLHATISLGNHALPDTVVRRLQSSRVELIRYADQWRELSRADVFVTHHGINSTHESIFTCTPMISRPFFGDQPAMAARCQQLGLATALANGAGDTVDATGFATCLADIAEHREDYAGNLEEAMSWELRLMENRAHILDRVRDLANARS